MLRRIVALKDAHYLDYVKHRRVLNQVVECFRSNGPRNNALNSALIELFEFMRTEEIRSLMELTIDEHWEETFSGVDYVQTFRQMKIRVEQFKHGRSVGMGGGRDSISPITTPTSARVGGPSSGAASAQWRKERDYDSDEIFFSSNDEDEEEESGAAGTGSAGAGGYSIPEFKSWGCKDFLISKDFFEFLKNHPYPLPFLYLSLTP